MLNILPRRQVRTTTAHPLRLELPGSSMRLRSDDFPNNTVQRWHTEVHLLVLFAASRLLLYLRPTFYRFPGQNSCVCSVEKWSAVSPRITTPPFTTGCYTDFWLILIHNGFEFAYKL
jgi:hypothetical protein